MLSLHRLYSLFGRRTKSYQEVNRPHPLGFLEAYVGRELVVHHLTLGKSVIDHGILRFPPSEGFFYLGERGGVGYHIINLRQKDDAVRLITDAEGNTIYEDPEIPFDQKSAKIVGIEQKA